MYTFWNNCGICTGMNKHFMKIPLRIFSIIFFVAFTFIANPSHAQIKFGPKIGLNFSELPNNTQYIIKEQFQSGYNLGGIVEFRLYDELFFQPGILISNKGSEYIVGNNNTSSTTGFTSFQFSSFYVDIPFNLIYKFNLRFFKLILLAGPQLGYGSTGKWEATDGKLSKVHFGNDPEDDLLPFDYGLNFGGGFEAGRFQITSEYYMGLRTLSTLAPPLEEQKYKVITISIAYLFGKDQKAYMDYESRYLRKRSRNKSHR
jgi:hypothetical protein